MVSATDWERDGALAVPLAMHGEIAAFVPELLRCIRGWLAQSLEYTPDAACGNHVDDDGALPAFCTLPSPWQPARE